jgi:DNA-binding NtrC family response regulator
MNNVLILNEDPSIVQSLVEFFTPDFNVVTSNEDVRAMVAENEFQFVIIEVIRNAEAELIRKLLEYWKINKSGTKFIAIASTDGDNQMLLQEHGFDAVVSKPIDFERFREIIKNLTTVSWGH